MTLRHLIAYKFLFFLRKWWFPNEALKAANDANETKCKYCRADSLLSFEYGVAQKDESHELHSVALSLKRFMKLRFGGLYTCQTCQSLWYYNPETRQMMRTKYSQLPLIVEWNKAPITLSDMHKQFLENIGETPHDLYENGKDVRHFPCGVITAGGEDIKAVVVSFQKHPPYDSGLKCRFASEISEIRESPFALPLEVRIATSQAREIRNSFAPTTVEVDGEKFTLNWTRNFFLAEGHSAKNVRLAAPIKEINSMPRSPGGPKEVVLFIADYIEP